jgi:transcriptional regulator with XRE-family HTH domain
MEGALQTTVGRNLRRVRRERKLSQERFGDQLGWHRTFVGAVERGERNLTLKTVERLSDQLGVNPLDLLWDQEGIGVALAEDGRTRFVPRATPRVITPPASRGAGASGPVAMAADSRTGKAPAAEPTDRRRRPNPK